MKRRGRGHYLAALKLERAGGAADEIVSLLRASAGKGYVEAQYALGTLYLHGKYLRKDVPAGMALIGLAAEQMHPAALFDMANAIETGDLPDVDKAEAFRCYVRSMVAGDRQAVYEVARCLFHGIGTLENRDLADVFMSASQALKERTGR